jgi:hypothetical protein
MFKLVWPRADNAILTSRERRRNQMEVGESKEEPTSPLLKHSNLYILRRSRSRTPRS